MRVRVVFHEGRDASDTAVRFLFLFGYWAQGGQLWPNAAEEDIAVIDRQPGYVRVVAPTDVALATMLLVIEWRNHPVIASHARLLVQLDSSPTLSLRHPFFAGMPPAYPRGLALLPQVLAVLPEERRGT